MKFLLVSDLHYTLQQFDWLRNVAGDFDLLVLAGDHLDISSTVEIDVQILVVLKYLRRLKARVAVAACSGNHDLNTRSSDGEKIATWLAKARPFGVPTDGDSFAVGDTLFTVCPWWDGPAAQNEVGGRYCQLKPNLAPSTRGAGNLIPDKSMDYSQVNRLFSVQFSLS